MDDGLVGHVTRFYFMRDDDDDDDGGGGDDDVGGDGDDGGGGGAPGGGGWNGNIPSIGRGGLSDDEDDLEEMPLE